MKKLQDHKCMSIGIASCIIILDNLDVYEVHQFQDKKGGKIKYEVKKQPFTAANINFNEYYGDGKDTAKANWTCEHFPVYEVEGRLIWNY